MTPLARRDDTDPLYEPTWAIFIYSAWAGLTWFVSERVGLIALVVLTLALATTALSKPHPSGARPFVADFSAILLFCAMSIGAAVLLFQAIRAPEVLLALALFIGAGAILVDLHRRELRDKRQLINA